MRRLLRAALVVLLIAPGALPAFGAAAAPRIGPAAGWVTPLALPEVDASTVRAKHGYEFVLYDKQVRITTPGQSVYHRIAKRAVNEAGLDDVSNLEIRYNPVYETLTLHEISVRRAGHVTSRLAQAAIKVLDLETEIEDRILDGRKTAHVFLDDVRVGDVVSYAYTIDGLNPVFKDIHFGHFDLQWSMPVESQRYRLLWPVGRPLKLLARNGAALVAPTVSGGFEERVWTSARVASLTVEADAPGWYDPYPTIDYGDLDSWGAVVDWAAPLYSNLASLGPELTKAIRSIADAYALPQDRAAEALRLVQRSVRYLGVEIGVNSHLPQPPDLVFRRRFGDCKDKAMLLVAMLRALGIDASPALVNTDVRRGIAARLPSPGEFDHVIVQVRLGNEVYWLDPTRSTQPGPLQLLYQPDYGNALVLRPGTRALTSMGGPAHRLNKRDISIVVDAKGGEGKPATMVVTTTYEGVSADIARGDVSSRALADMEKSYLNFYANRYPGITTTAALDVRDEPEANRLTVVERYSLPSFWHQAEGADHLQSAVYTDELDEFIKETPQPVRKSPLRVRYPLQVTVTTEVSLPHSIRGRTSHEKVGDSAFDYEGSVAWPQPDHLLMTDAYRTLADEIPAERVALHNEKLDKVRKQLGYVIPLTPAPSARSGTGRDWLIILLCALLGVGLWRGARVLFRSR